VSARVGRIGLRLETSRDGHEAAERIARELRGALPGAIETALAPYAADDDVAIVPRLRITVRAPLAATTGRAIARTIADACARTIASDAAPLAPHATGASTSAAETLLERLTPDGGVRADAATEAAAWLIALALDERPDFRRISSFADDEHLATPAALVAACERCGASAVFRRLGRTWARTLASRASAREARALLRLLDDDDREPSPETWAYARAALRAAGGASEQLELRAVLVAVDGVLAERPGIGAAVRSLLAAPTRPAGTTSRDADRAAGLEHPEPGDERGPAVASACTGFWLLLPHLARRVGSLDDETARLVAAGVAACLWGSEATTDPAIAAFLTGATAEAMLRHDGVRIERLAVAAVRDFARTLFRFERARCGYVLRSMLYGPAVVWHEADRWFATLPQSPLRVVVERTAPYGDVAAPWAEPALTMVRDP
jgi:hypothetical protein